MPRKDCPNEQAVERNGNFSWALPEQADILTFLASLCGVIDHAVAMPGSLAAAQWLRRFENARSTSKLDKDK